MANIHHATAKRAASLGAELLDQGTVVQVVCAGVVLAEGPNGKDALFNAEAAMAEAGYETLAELAEDWGAEAEADEGEAEELEEEGSALARQMAKFRKRYSKRDGRMSNGDALAIAMQDATAGLEGEALRSAICGLAGANGIDVARYVGMSNGQLRMNVGNRLRAKARKDGVLVGGQVVKL